MEHAVQVKEAQTTRSAPALRAENLRLQYGAKIVLENLNFEINPGEVYALIGGSGCGKSTLLRHLVGLHAPAAGQIFYGGGNFTTMNAQQRRAQLQKIGVLFQGGALLSNLTVAENIALPLEQYTRYDAPTIRALASSKLALVGLAGFEDATPASLSGGQKKRAGLARAMALNPSILFFDEPSAGLDPVTARALDDLILELKNSLGTTIVLVTHELASLFRVADRLLFLDKHTQTAIAQGAPSHLKEQGPESVRTFLSGG